LTGLQVEILEPPQLTGQDDGGNMVKSFAGYTANWMPWPKSPGVGLADHKKITEIFVDKVT
jgi:hypothetical protein